MNQPGLHGAEVVKLAAEQKALAGALAGAPAGVLAILGLMSRWRHRPVAMVAA